MNTLDPTIEAYLRSTIFPDMEHGRPNWDVPHTQAVVAYIKKIVAASPELQLDASVLIIAAYAHDWGYSGLFAAGRPITFAENLDQKATHMRLGSEKIKTLLQDSHFAFLTPVQKERIVHLVAVHDDLDNLHDTDELVLMEADTLGMTDPDAVTPTHTKAEFEAWRVRTERARIARFITPYGKQKIHELMARREQFYAHRRR
ncbi:MAG TPA: hypothetical protein VHC98_01585 [Candidatus Saccharimonadales bacterium]|nr:hypothetical protein [Candidatus Saccharimonadales bacterium]